MNLGLKFERCAPVCDMVSSFVDSDYASDLDKHFNN